MVFKYIFKENYEVVNKSILMFIINFFFVLVVLREGDFFL